MFFFEAYWSTGSTWTACLLQVSLSNSWTPAEPGKPLPILFQTYSLSQIYSLEQNYWPHLQFVYMIFFFHNPSLLRVEWLQILSKTHKILTRKGFVITFPKILKWESYFISTWLPHSCQHLKIIGGISQGTALHLVWFVSVCPVLQLSYRPGLISTASMCKHRMPSGKEEC